MKLKLIVDVCPPDLVAGVVLTGITSPTNNDAYALDDGGDFWYIADYQFKVIEETDWENMYNLLLDDNGKLFNENEKLKKKPKKSQELISIHQMLGVGTKLKSIEFH